ncbi:MAG TPA: efflux RND transporter permease subunit [Ktedonobacteraceae bacterium]|nr:efflux RND transporter permease subunit [Ktedonobacteraceae bacterium]
MSFLSRISLANRSLVALATIAILLFGGLVIPSIKQELYPSLEFPAVTVITAYPGASPAVVEQDITDPLEQSIQGTQDIEQMTSYSNEGSSVILVSYNFGTDINAASQKLAQQIARAQATLPSSVTPQVQTFNLSDLPIIHLAVSSNADQATLAADLKARVVPVLTGISGVADVTVTGVREEVVTITLDPAKMQTAGLSVTQLQQALGANNVSIPAGEMTGNGQTLPIRVSNTFKSLDDLRNLIVGAKTSLKCPPNGPTVQPGPISGGLIIGTVNCKSISTPIHLSDVASVEPTLAPSTSLTRTNGQPSVGISITKTSDGNTVDISQAIKDKISTLQNQLGNGATITVISDQAPMITSSVSGLVREGLIGAGFAILIILLFLFSIRSTLVTAVSIPLSIVIALIALWAGNLTLNLFTLGGMTIAVGRVVDDSIVVLENIHRHLSNGDEKRVAIPAAVREVAGAVTSSTLTTVAVFLPIAFTGGLVGEVFGPFAITVTVALLASLFVALTIIPVLAYWFLKVPKASTGVHVQHEKQTLLERGYVPIVRWVTGHKAISLIVAIVLFFGTISLTPLLGTNFFSSSQQNTYSISQTLPVGTSLAVTDAAVQKVEAVLHDMSSRVQTYQVTIGSVGTFASISGASGGPNGATFSITSDPNTDQAAFQQDLQNRLNGLTDVGTLKLSVRSGGFNSTGVAINVQAPDQATLASATQQVLGAFSKVSDVTDISSNLADAAPLIDVQVDPLKAAVHGLTPFQVAQALSQIYTGSPVVTATRSAVTINVNSQQESIILRLGTPATSVADMQKLLLPAQAGYVRLGDVATVNQTLGPTQVTHIGGQRTATVSATATTNNVGSVTAQIQKQLDSLHLPAGVTVSMGGVGQSQAEAFGSLGLALLAAILLVYLVMVGTFRSLVQPLILLVSIPFAATGSLLLMLATHTQLGVPSLIGLLMLIGIVVTNAIVLLDLVRQYRAQGMDARTAVVEGGRRRLRPILMTAVATILALLPMALGLSKDSGFIAAPLAVTVIGGLTTSTILTLLLVPTLYVLIEGRKDRKGNSPVQARPAEEQAADRQEVAQGA